jgi:hypothetical protein
MCNRYLETVEQASIFYTTNDIFTKRSRFQLFQIHPTTGEIWLDDASNHLSSKKKGIDSEKVISRSLMLTSLQHNPKPTWINLAAFSP